MNKESDSYQSRHVSHLERFLRNHLAGMRSRVRNAYLRRSFANYPKNFSTNGPIVVKHPQHVFIGKQVVFSEGVYINASAKVIIGDHVTFSAYVRINTGFLPLDVPPEKRRHVLAPVHIGNFVWLATNVIVNPGVTIHDGVIVGSGAVVTHDLPPYTLCVGVPARPIRELPRPDANIK